MSMTAFYKLCTLLKCQLAPSSKSRRDPGVITVKAKIMVTLILFALSSYFDLIHKHGISKTGMCKVILQVTKTISRNPDTGKQIKFLTSTSKSCEMYVKDWPSLSGPT
jgi:hypothetical protein